VSTLYKPQPQSWQAGIIAGRSRAVVETRTIDDDQGRRCSCCDRDIYRHTKTWWIARHGEYCSQACACVGAAELELLLNTLEMNNEERGGELYE
jgi:hypothetical protein